MATIQIYLDKKAEKRIEKAREAGYTSISGLFRKLLADFEKDKLRAT